MRRKNLGDSYTKVPPTVTTTTTTATTATTATTTTTTATTFFPSSFLNSNSNNNNNNNLELYHDKYSFLRKCNQSNYWIFCKKVTLYTCVLILFIHFIHVLIFPWHWPAHLVILWTEHHIQSLEHQQPIIENKKWNIKNIEEKEKKRKKEPMILVGLGCMKCGSSFWQDLLSSSNPMNVIRNEKRKQTLNKTWIIQQMKAHKSTIEKEYFIQSYSNKSDMERYNIIEHEHKGVIEFIQPTWRADLGYAKECYWRGLGARSGHYSQCIFNEYISLWETIDYQWEKHKHVVLVEKTPTYMRDPSAMHILSYFASKHRLKFYICLRNPIKRTWSHVWFTCKNRRQSCEYTADNVIASLEDALYTKMKRYSHEFYRMFQLLNNNDPIINQKDWNIQIMQIYINAYYNFVFEIDNIKENIANHERRSGKKRLQYKRVIASLFTSCYYPQILMIYSYLQNYNLVNEHTNVLKIFQMEKVSGNYSALVYDLKCWIWKDLFENDPHQNNCQYEYVTLPQDMWLYPSRSPHPGDYTGEITPSLYQQLGLFFQNCNLRLHEFLTTHPHLLLNNYWDIDLWN